jgi:hypothetical protein
VIDELRGAPRLPAAQEIVRARQFGIFKNQGECTSFVNREK